MSYVSFRVWGVKYFVGTIFKRPGHYDAVLLSLISISRFCDSDVCVFTSFSDDGPLGH